MYRYQKITWGLVVLFFITATSHMLNTLTKCIAFAQEHPALAEEFLYLQIMTFSAAFLLESAAGWLIFKLRRRRTEREEREKKDKAFQDFERRLREWDK